MILIRRQQNQLSMMKIIQQHEKPLLARPLPPSKQKSNNKTPQTNIFAQLRSTQPVMSLHKLRGKSFDFIGTAQFKEKYIQTVEKQSKNSPTIHQKEADLFTEADKQFALINTNQNLSSTQVMNSTLNRNTILSKMSKDQTNMATKQTRQLNRYKQYQQYWQQESQKLHRKSLRKQNEKTLLEDEVKGVYVQPNKNRMGIINDNVVHMWEMSLRNNNKKLLDHIKGNKFKQTQLEQLLQSQNGVKAVEKTIPILPVQNLKAIKKRQLSLTGRNKSYNSTYKTGYQTERLSQGQSNKGEQVYKISYECGNKWLTTQGL